MLDMTLVQLDSIVKELEHQRITREIKRQQEDFKKQAAAARNFRR